MAPSSSPAGVCLRVPDHTDRPTRRMPINDSGAVPITDCEVMPITFRRKAGMGARHDGCESVHEQLVMGTCGTSRRAGSLGPHAHHLVAVGAAVTANVRVRRPVE